MVHMPSDHEQVKAWDREYSAGAPVWKGPAQFELDIPAGSTVLEIGCGNGKNIGSLMGNGAEVMALDMSRKGLLACKRQIGELKNLHLVQALATALPLPDACIDVVVASHVFEHMYFDDRARAATEIKRVLRKDGFVYLRMFSNRDMRNGKGKLVEKGTFPQRERESCTTCSKWMRSFPYLKVSRSIILRNWNRTRSSMG